MNKTPQELVDRFIETRDAVRAAFRMENEYIYPVCAQIFLAADKPVEIEQLERCKALVKSSTSVFSSFRGNVKLPLLCMLQIIYPVLDETFGIEEAIEQSRKRKNEE